MDTNDKLEYILDKKLSTPLDCSLNDIITGNLHGRFITIFEGRLYNMLNRGLMANLGASLNKPFDNEQIPR